MEFKSFFYCNSYNFIQKFSIIFFYFPFLPLPIITLYPKMQVILSWYPHNILSYRIDNIQTVHIQYPITSGYCRKASGRVFRATFIIHPWKAPSSSQAVRLLSPLPVPGPRIPLPTLMPFLQLFWAKYTHSFFTSANNCKCL